MGGSRTHPRQKRTATAAVFPKLHLDASNLCAVSRAAGSPGVAEELEAAQLQGRPAVILDEFSFLIWDRYLRTVPLLAEALVAQPLLAVLDCRHRGGSLVPQIEANPHTSAAAALYSFAAARRHP